MSFWHSDARSMVNNSWPMHTCEQVTSIVGSRVHRFAGPAYATSKAALGALTREIAAEYGQLGLRYISSPI
jgi:hypothetical protein